MAALLIHTCDNAVLIDSIEQAGRRVLAGTDPSIMPFMGKGDARGSCLG